MSSVERNRTYLLALSVALAFSLNLTVTPVLAAAKSANPPALSQGMTYYNKGYIQQAISAFEEASQRAPSEQAFLWLARSYAKQGGEENVAKARQAFSQVLAYNPDNVEALTTLGEVYSWDMSTRPESITMLRRAYNLKPSDSSIAKKLALALYWDNQNQEAYQIAQPIAQENVGDPKFLAAYAQILSQSGHPDEALSIYENNLNIQESRDLALLQAYTSALVRGGQRSRAVEVFQSIKPYVVQLAPDQGLEIKRGMASLAFELELYEDAIALDQSLPGDIPNQPQTKIRVARALMRSQRTPEAIDAFYKLYQAGQLSSAEKIEFADYVQSLNLSPENLPQPNLVSVLYQDALRDDPSNVDSALRLAQNYRYQNGHFADSIQYYQQALQASLNDEAKHEGIQREYLEFLRTNKSDKAAAGQILRDLAQADPTNYELRGSLAEFLSYDTQQRPEAIRMYLALVKEDTVRQDYWKEQLDKVLSWHKPTTDLIPLYQEIVDTFPNDRTIWLSVARAYAENPRYYRESLGLYEQLLAKYPDDVLVKKEWINLLIQDDSRRPETIRIFLARINQHPDDLDVRTALGKLYSYDRKYNHAFDQFDAVLSQKPDHKEALIGKGYTLMWSGRKLEAKDHFIDVTKVYPDDIDVALGLAQANKFLGRYDEAFEVMKNIRDKMRGGQSGYLEMEATHPLILCWYESVMNSPVLALQRPLEMAFAPVPEFQEEESLHSPDEAAAPVPDMVIESPVSPSPVTLPPATMMTLVQPVKPTQSVQSAQDQVIQNEVQSDIDSLNAAIESMEMLQKASTNQLNQLQSQLSTSSDRITAQISVQDERRARADAKAESMWLYNMAEELAVFSSLSYDTNPLLSGLGRFRNNDLIQMESGLTNDLRPMLRAGYDWTSQSGEETTSRLRSWGFPNQLAISLSPQVRARFGVNPFKYYIPTRVSRNPNSTWSQEYTWGLTAKVTDKLTLDGDMAITNFNQSDTQNITYQANLNYDFNDQWHAKIGSRRYPQFNSLLNIAGLRPGLGAFSGNLVGQARETTAFAELSWTPNANWDVNAGYEWAFVDGSRIPDNIKNSAYFSPGYTWYYAAKHKVRMGYEFYYMGYDKNTTAGFFDVTNAGGRRPVAGLDPVVRAQDGVDFGGYFSPKWFIQNAGRLDFRGSLFDQFMEYKIGGSLGVQTFGEGHGIRPGNVTAMTASADANLITNFTDWLAMYLYGEYLNAGAIYSRWRFGGGLILRPSIDILSPVFNRSHVPPVQETNAPETQRR